MHKKKKIVAIKTAAAKTVAVKTAKVKKTIAMNTAATTTKSMKKSVKRTPAPTKRALDVFTKPSHTDVNGSYTGVPQDSHETPVQDADDL